MTTIVLCAGEASGDQLGASLINQLRARRPDLRFVGIGGPAMRAAGIVIAENPAGIGKAMVEALGRA